MDFTGRARASFGVKVAHKVSLAIYDTYHDACVYHNNVNYTSMLQ